MDASTFRVTPWPKVYVLGPDSVACELEQPDVELHLRRAPGSAPIAFWLTSDGTLLAFVDVGRA